MADMRKRNKERFTRRQSLDFADAAADMAAEMGLDLHHNVDVAVVMARNAPLHAVTQIDDKYLDSQGLQSADDLFDRFVKAVEIVPLDSGHARYFDQSDASYQRARTAARGALMGMTRAANPDTDWGDQEVSVRGKDFRMQDVVGGKLYHGSPTKLEEGVVLSPRDGDRNYEQSSGASISITSDKSRAGHWGSLEGKVTGYVYEVDPIGEITPRRVGLANRGRNFVLWEGTVPGAEIVKLVTTRKRNGETRTSNPDVQMPPQGFFESSVYTDILYKGTNEAIRPGHSLNPFGGHEYGIYLTPNHRYARQWGENLVEAFVSLKNPLVVEGKYEISPKDLEEADVVDLEDEGYDGIIVTSTSIEKASEVVLFDRNQVWVINDARRLK